MIYDFDIYLYWMGKGQKQCFARNIGSINMRTHKNYITNKQHKSRSSKKNDDLTYKQNMGYDSMNKHGVYQIYNI